MAYLNNYHRKLQECTLMAQRDLDSGTASCYNRKRFTTESINFDNLNQRKVECCYGYYMFIPPPRRNSIRSNSKFFK